MTSPPYPRIRREYGRWEELDWLRWMRAVVRSARRVLKESGSMVFVIGPNVRAAGSLAPWPYQFILDLFAADLNVVQDAYWVKVCRPPTAAIAKGYLRDAVEWCVWIGSPDCYRDRASVLLEYAESTKRLMDLARRSRLEDGRRVSPGGISINRSRMLRDRGGATPLNAVATANAGREAMGHPAAFPKALAEFWIKYLCPPGGVVLDPFAGSGTTCAVAKRLGRRWVGVEKIATYARKARQRVREAPGPELSTTGGELSTIGLGSLPSPCRSGRQNDKKPLKTKRARK